jgi:glycopeptide antibiotics resistance protein
MLSKPIWRVLALGVTVALFCLALRVDVYNATSPRALEKVLFGSNAFEFPHPWWFSLHIWVRKCYSIVAFGLIGFTVDRALPPTQRPALRSAAIVATFSLGIEIAQRLFVANEPNLESVLDVCCGALAGWLAIVCTRSLRKSDARRLPAAHGVPARPREHRLF